VSPVKILAGSGWFLGASPAFQPVPLSDRRRRDMAQQIDRDQEGRPVAGAFRFRCGLLGDRDGALSLHERGHREGELPRPGGA
jgi:hypothetical protein